MKKILVPVDFSDNSLRALFYAGELASAGDAVIYLLYVHEPGHEKRYQPLTLHDKFNNLIVSDSERRLSDWKRILTSRFQKVAVKEAVLGGHAAERILQFATEKKIDLIIIGNTGAGRATRLMFGSVANQLIRLSHIPLITIPADADTSLKGPLVFATSHFEKEIDLLQPLADLVTIYGTVLHIVFFSEEKEDVSAQLDHALKLENYKSFMRRHYAGVSCQFAVLQGRDFAEAVEDYIIKQGAGLLAMVPYHKGFFARLRSTTQMMAFQSSVPVLILTSATHVKGVASASNKEKTGI